MLAQAQGQAPSEVTSESVTSEETNGTETQTKTKQPSKEQTTESKGQQPYAWGNILFLVLIAVVFYMLFLRGPRKRQQEQKKMVHSLQKNDRIRTIGGIIGTIVEVKENELILKIDESTNTKMRISSSAVAVNLSRQQKS